MSSFHRTTLFPSLNPVDTSNILIPPQQCQKLALAAGQAGDETPQHAGLTNGLLTTLYVD
jgi:hypothetical protein